MVPRRWTWDVILFCDLSASASVEPLFLMLELGDTLSRQELAPNQC